MSGKHYKGPEVSCCIKYFIFGFNVIFWTSLAGEERTLMEQLLQGFRFWE
uniref:Tetraspanin 5 n=1 Tax=Mus musculus TaxID=10090 RepID=D6RG91_MOUSE